MLNFSDVAKLQHWTCLTSTVTGIVVEHHWTSRHHLGDHISKWPVGRGGLRSPWLEEAEPMQQLNRRAVRRQNKSALCPWFCPCALSLSSPCCRHYWPWVWSQHIVLELPRFCDLMLLVYFNFPFCYMCTVVCFFFSPFFFLFCSWVHVRKMRCKHNEAMCTQRI